MNSCKERVKPVKKSRARRASEPGPSIAPCFVVAADCSDPEVPAVSSDCGITSTVVRAWSARDPGTGAPYALTETIFCCDCCDCDDAFVC